MDKQLFDYLVTIFKQNGFHIYLVGGAVRDYLLNLPIDDYDFVSDATPFSMQKFLPEGDYTFAKYGSVKVKINGVKIEITTLRKESEYVDSRHPSKIEFVKQPIEDYSRRDFTINALYLDENYNVLDFCNGLDDLKNKLIRFIGDPQTRIKEDPLRILRAKRFATKLNFKIEDASLKAIQENETLLHQLNPAKIAEELKKFK